MRRQRRPLGSEKIKAQVVIKLAEEAQIVIKKKKKIERKKILPIRLWKPGFAW